MTPETQALLELLVSSGPAGLLAYMLWRANKRIDVLETRLDDMLDARLKDHQTALRDVTVALTGGDLDEPRERTGRHRTDGT